MTFYEEQSLESLYVMPTFARKPVELVEGSGMYVVDDAGKRYLDFIAGIGVCSLGHCHPAVVNALQKQAERLIHVGNYYYIEGRGSLSRSLSALLNGGQNADEPYRWQSFYANSGAEANECAIKLARLYARKKTLAQKCDKFTTDEQREEILQGLPRYIVTLNGSFHGRTLTTVAATAQPAKQECFKPLPGGFIHVQLNDIETLEELFKQRGKEICAVMVESVQGESGVHPLEKDYFAALRRITLENDALLICDEVQCGVYRCGKPFAYQLAEVMPDIVTLAKGIASGMVMGVCSAKEHIAHAYQPGDHGSTFGGSCLAVAAARATLDELSHGYDKHIEEVGSYFKGRLAEIPGLSNIRGAGLMIACDLPDTLNANEVVARGLDVGLLLNATGPCTLRFLPPLICEREHIDELIERLAPLIA